MPCPQCGVPNFLAHTSPAYAYATASVSVTLTVAGATASASASASSNTFLRRLANGQVTDPDVEQILSNVTLPDVPTLSFPNGTAPSELPGLLGAYSYDPTNKTTAVLYNVTDPDQPPSIDAPTNDQPIYYYGNASQGLNTTSVDDCPQWCWNMGDEQRPDVPDCLSCQG